IAATWRLSPSRSASQRKWDVSCRTDPWHRPEPPCASPRRLGVEFAEIRHWRPVIAVTAVTSIAQLEAAVPIERDVAVVVRIGRSRLRVFAVGEGVRPRSMHKPQPDTIRRQNVAEQVFRSGFVLRLKEHEILMPRQRLKGANKETGD